VITKEKEEVKYQYPVPMPTLTKKINNNFNGNLIYTDGFRNSTLNKRYIFLRNPEADLYSIAGKKGGLLLPLKPQTASGKENPAFIGFRQSNIKGTAVADMAFTATSPNEKAGLLIFQNETHYYFLCKSVENNQPVVQLYKSPEKQGADPELLASQVLSSNAEIRLRIVSNGDGYAFSYKLSKDFKVLLKDSVDGKFLSTKLAGGFVGSIYALYATSNGKPTINKASFRSFSYIGNDDILVNGQ
jgi:alpha-N-arabinofuranosidase